MSLRDSMRESAATYLRPDETVQAVIGAQTASQWLVPLTGFVFFPLINSYRIIAVTSQRIVILDSGKSGIKKARGVVTEIPRSTQLGPVSGVWTKIPAGDETLRVHRRFRKDIDAANNAVTVP